VMSVWQHGVDWFLAKYCRWRLPLDWCWCRCRTSAKGRCRWGLQVWKRQVGLVRGTRWPAELSVGREVARTARWSHGQFLSWASKPRLSRDYVGAESWVMTSGGYTEFAWFRLFTRKPLGSLVDRQSQDQRPKTEVQQHRTGLTGGSNWSDRWVPVWPVRSMGLSGVRRRSPETSTRRTHVGITRLA
jgi:hypothetical protein